MEQENRAIILKQALIHCCSSSLESPILPARTYTEPLVCIVQRCCISVDLYRNCCLFSTIIVVLLALFILLGRAQQNWKEKQLACRNCFRGFRAEGKRLFARDNGTELSYPNRLLAIVAHLVPEIPHPPTSTCTEPLVCIILHCWIFADLYCNRCPFGDCCPFNPPYPPSASCTLVPHIGCGGSCCCVKCCVLREERWEGGKERRDDGALICPPRQPSSTAKMRGQGSDRAHTAFIYFSQ